MPEWLQWGRPVWVWLQAQESDRVHTLSDPRIVRQLILEARRAVVLHW